MELAGGIVKAEILFAGERLCLDFVNTAFNRLGTPMDLLGNPEELSLWLRSAHHFTGLPHAVEGAACSPQTLAKALKLRTALRALVESKMDSTPASAEAVKILNATLEANPLYEGITTGKDGYHRSLRTIHPPEAWLTEVARDAVDLLCFGDPSLLRQCECDGCIRVFYDTTKNHKRRWCTEKCGNRSKAAAYYRRKVAKAQAGLPESE